MKSTLRGNHSILLIFGLVFAVIFIFSSLTPLIGDDFDYCFSWADGSRMTNLGQIFPSMAAHRATVNGRVVAHSIVQALLMLPKPVFNLLNALNAMLLTALFARCLEKEHRALLLVIGAFMVWCFTPFFGEIFLWLDGSVNYSWGMSIFLLFLWPYIAVFMGKERHRSTVRDLLLVLLAFFAGAYSENGSIAVIFAAACLSAMILLRDRRLPWQLTAGLVLAVLGFVFLMSAGATRGRGAPLSFSHLGHNLYDIVALTKELILPLLIIYAVLVCLCLVFKTDRKKLALSIVLVLAGLGSLAAFVFALYFEGRHFCFTVIFLVLASLILMDALAGAGKRLPSLLLCAALSVLFAVEFTLGAADIAITYKLSREREAAIQTALDNGETDIALDVFLSTTDYCPVRYNMDLADDSVVWPNLNMARYYGLNSVIGSGYDRQR